MMTVRAEAIVALLAAAALLPADGGPVAYGICQTACNASAVACYASAGYIYGTVTAGIGIPAAVASCNAALGLCMGLCTPLLVVPTP